MTHAERELEILVKSHEDPENRPIIEEFIPEILELVKKFGESEQSGGSAPFTARALSQAIEKLCLFEPICPITGIDEEWSKTFDDTYQNKRCSALFKKGNDGNPYFLDGVVFQGEDEYDTFTGKVEEITSSQFIKEFPFTPKTFYIDVYREEYNEEKHGTEDEVR